MGAACGGPAGLRRVSPAVLKCTDKFRDASPVLPVSAVGLAQAAGPCNALNERGWLGRGAAQVTCPKVRDGASRRCHLRLRDWAALIRGRDSCDGRRAGRACVRPAIAGVSGRPTERGCVVDSRGFIGPACADHGLGACRGARRAADISWRFSEPDVREAPRTRPQRAARIRWSATAAARGTARRRSVLARPDSKNALAGPQQHGRPMCAAKLVQPRRAEPVSSATRTPAEAAPALLPPMSPDHGAPSIDRNNHLRSAGATRQPGAQRRGTAPRTHATW